MGEACSVGGGGGAEGTQINGSIEDGQRKKTIDRGYTLLGFGLNLTSISRLERMLFPVSRCFTGTPHSGTEPVFFMKPQGENVE